MLLDEFVQPDVLHNIFNYAIHVYACTRSRIVRGESVTNQRIARVESNNKPQYSKTFK